MPEQDAPRFLRVVIEETEHHTVVQCHGYVISGLSDHLYTKVRPLIPHKKKIVLDLAEVKWMDSMGLGTLVGLYTSAKGHGCELELRHIGKRVRELLGLTHLLDVFVIIGERGVKM